MNRQLDLLSKTVLGFFSPQNLSNVDPIDAFLTPFCRISNHVSTYNNRTRKNKDLINIVLQVFGYA